MVQPSRARGQASSLLAQLRRYAACWRPLLILIDGWSAYLGSIRRANRKISQADGGAWTSLCGRVWPELHIDTVIKHIKKKRSIEISRRMAHGLLGSACELL